MFFSAQEKTVETLNGTMTYVVFGQGEQPLVVLPGLADGLRTVHGQKYNLAFYLRKLIPHFKIYVFSRRNKLKAGYTTRDMAKDQVAVLQQLEIEDAYVLGISQGGMIAQYMAIDFPEMVSKLVLGVTVSKPNETLQQVAQNWIKLAKADDYPSLMRDVLEKTYSSKLFNKYKLILPILLRIGKPKSFERFLIQANACLTHDAFQELGKIQCPTLNIGGDSDQIVGKDASEKIAEQIFASQLIIYEGLGHGTHEEEKRFYLEVLNFLQNK